MIIREYTTDTFCIVSCRCDEPRHTDASPHIRQISVPSIDFAKRLGWIIDDDNVMCPACARVVPWHLCTRGNGYIANVGIWHLSVIPVLHGWRLDIEISGDVIHSIPIDADSVMTVEQALTHALSCFFSWLQVEHKNAMRYQLAQVVIKE